MSAHRGVDAVDNDAVSVGAHEQCEAAMAVYQAERYRCLALLVSSYSGRRLT
jgi:hypothetical protein